MALVRLKHRGPLTIRDLAAQIGVTHSAMSQTVAVMKKDGLIESSPGADARTRLIALTDGGLALVPFLEAEWRATEAAWAELEDEVPYPLARVVDDLNRALARRSFRDRLLGHLDPRFRS
ncbi:MarR family winged helix-turn-helix transcriptional regulator [uncultured Arthrobacter sp.]|uniref:MarR family winged helix-turn-helix transcriptional regulator n=1 Tax=uncultured Arthrobacter sp. TaxID=114050 RepID=UPI002611D93F|nr:MarR family transcriptional regulator [uncultured Arthrobacter sp.]